MGLNLGTLEEPSLLRAHSPVSCWRVVGTSC